MEINVLSFDMPNTMYNIDSKNNEFDIITPTQIVRKSIPEGNYSMRTFMTQVKTLIGTTLINIAYNEVQNTYTFAKSPSLTGVYTIPEGNYSMRTFMTQVKTLIGTTLINIVYNEVQNTFAKSPLLTGVYKIKHISIGQLIGALNNTEYEIGTSGYTTGLINLINYNKVMVSCTYWSMVKFVSISH